ncbi:hypothetical protein [Sulfurisphaera ohwakuensis]|uniref:Uncharacterized protein n=1 Tax=Sulfurisphaera ohwakuensis TaxID=69656 RepID=A0A650CI28_SULOH|nr:hypothetical protein [Sulfurisphaera ohwakuensis]MBB5253545.1 hypothetical protein [Sulfurisphaera ohwakuensis]QGR17433.1 hypothetical protein D1869_09665 [Sulfurisphaera ohwakuensis]
MDKVEIEFKPFEGDKLAIFNKNIVENLSQYLQLKDNMEAKRHIIMVFVNDEKEEKAVDFFVKESKLNGILIIIKRVLK